MISVFLISCDGSKKDSPLDISHIHAFDLTTRQCSCGIIEDGVVAYIGESYEKAIARFLTLQDAVDYLANQISKGNSKNTIHGYKSEILCDGLVIDNIEVEFDFSNSVVKFTGTQGIVVKGKNSKVEISGKKLESAESVTILIKIEEGSLSTDIDFKGNIEAKDADLVISGDNVEITGFVNNSVRRNKIKLTSSSITLSLPIEEIKKFAEQIEASSTSQPLIAEHIHNYVKDPSKHKDPTYEEEGYECYVCDGCLMSYAELIAKKEYRKVEEITSTGKVVKYYDDQDVLVKIENFDIQGNPEKTTKKEFDSTGEHLFSISYYDSKNLLTKKEVFDFDENVLFIFIYDYREDNKLAKYRVLDSEENVLYAYTIEYENNGNWKEYEYDFSTNEIDYSYYQCFDPNGNLLYVYAKDEYGSTEDTEYRIETYGTYGDDVKYEEFDSSGKLTYYHTHTYDSNNREIKIEEFDGNGNCTGYNLTSYDANGGYESIWYDENNELESFDRKTCDQEGRTIKREDGEYDNGRQVVTAYTEISYDVDGKRREERFVLRDGKYESSGGSISLDTFDFYGNVIKIQYFDSKDELISEDLFMYNSNLKETIMFTSMSADYLDYDSYGNEMHSFSQTI